MQIGPNLARQSELRGMKERAPAFQFFPRQFAGDDQVMGMDLEAIGAHILLICSAASSPERCRIDADEYAIRMRLRNPSDQSWERIKKQLLAGAWKLSADGKWWIQDGLRRTFEKQKNFSEHQRERANARWYRTDAELMPDSSRANAEPMPNNMPEVCSSSSSSSSKHKTKAIAVAPPNWIPVEPWTGFVEMRKRLRKPLTDRAMQLILGKLDKFRRAGVDVGAILDQSTTNGWQDVFELRKGKTDRNGNGLGDVITDNPATRALAQMESA